MCKALMAVQYLWNGLQQRRNSRQDGVYGTTCPIPPRKNFTYVLQAKDQIGTYFYFPSLALHKAAGGYGSIKISSRPRIPVPFPPPAGDWFKRSQRDGVYGTTCPIPPRKNFTYVLQAKDQIGTYFYFPSLALHKAAGGYGSIKISSRPRIPVPFPPPARDYAVLVGDWFKRSQRQLTYFLDTSHNLPFPDGLLINGRGWNGYTFTVDQGSGYRMSDLQLPLTSESRDTQ
ncbi:unnamed protein product [Fraxinus pennsylvanica]|uniref:Uncharacterized protein n=1 Tax=Fraxinus pennsylvanica TaxID=56036 RepID=A0AAD2ACV4_9LAMI|nr:unnamed protein product [Fraxinus pennsylvanica]